MILVDLISSSVVIVIGISVSGCKLHKFSYKISYLRRLFYFVKF